MIQRIQTIWLLLSAVILAGMFVFDYYSVNVAPEKPVGDIGNNYIGIVLIGLSIILSFVTIFKYKSLPTQLKFIWLNILVLIGLMAWLFYDITQIQQQYPGKYWIGAFLPLIAIVFQFMARAGVSKDRKLLKSLDRLR